MMKNGKKENTLTETNNEKNNKPLLFFSVTTLVAGQLIGFLSFKFFPVERTYNLPEIYPPTWMFPAIWCILYPCMGLSIGYIWQLRKQIDIRAVFICYLIMLTANLLFVPIMNLCNGDPGVMTLMDLNGVISSILFGWLCSGYSKKAFYWSLPLMIWMPITLIIKITLWMANP